MKKIIIIIQIIMIVGFLNATDYYVSNSGNDNNPGTELLPFLSLQYAIDQTTDTSFDTIFLLNSFITSTTINVDKNNLTITSSTGNPNTCYIDGDNEVPIMVIDGVYNFTLSNITIQNGESSDSTVLDAGGISFYDSGQLNVDNCIIKNCTGLNYGTRYVTAGIKCYNSSLTLNNIEAYNNNANYGFLRYFSDDPGTEKQLIISNSKIYNNTGQYSSGIYGLISNYVGLTVDNCLFYGNSNAISWMNNDLYNTYVPVNITNCTIVDNNVGLEINWNPAYDLDLKIGNTILRDNGTTSELPNNSNRIKVAYSNIEGLQSIYDDGTNIDAEPLFEDPGNGIDYPDTYGYGLTDDSPCIDTGDPASPLDPDNSLTDIGAYYFHHEYDYKRFEEGWQWVSFPYLSEQGIFENNMYEQAYYENGEPGLLQENLISNGTINGFSSILGRRDDKMSIYPSDGVYDENDNGFNNMLFRHEGYKINVELGANPTTLLVGDEQLTYYEEDLEEMEQYWRGYYLPRPTNIEDAFGDFWGDVNRVWAEDWYYDKLNNPRSAVPANSTKGKTMKYGKMYIIEMSSDADGFHWADAEDVSRLAKVEAPQYFDYTEKAEYEAIDILNIPNSVSEIGVFEDGECVGAVVVTDSTAQILVYSDQANRDTVPFTFEIVTDRGGTTSIKQYQVMNKTTGNFYPDVVISGRQDYSIVKFNKSENIENSITKPIIHGNYPNPFNPTTTISFSMSIDEEINITIFNIKGQKVKTIFSGIAEKGMHNISWNGKDMKDNSVSTGVYFYKLSTNTIAQKRKILLLK